MSDPASTRAPSSSVPALSREAPLPVDAVADVLARSRLGCVAPIGSVAILAFGFVAATSNVLPISVGQARAFTLAIVASAFAWSLVPWLMKRARAGARLRALGLSDAQIAAVRRVTAPILRSSGGMHGDIAEREIRAALGGDGQGA